jgi:hypothetical protein
VSCSVFIFVSIIYSVLASQDGDSERRSGRIMTGRVLEYQGSGVCNDAGSAVRAQCT